MYIDHSYNEYGNPEISFNAMTADELVIIREHLRLSAKSLLRLIEDKSKAIKASEENFILRAQHDYLFLSRILVLIDTTVPHEYTAIRNQA